MAKSCKTCAVNAKQDVRHECCLKYWGDIWVVVRNPYLVDDLLEHPKRRAALVREMRHRLNEIRKRRDDNRQVDVLVAAAEKAVERFDSSFDETSQKRHQIFGSLKQNYQAAQYYV